MATPLKTRSELRKRTGNPLSTSSSGLATQRLVREGDPGAIAAHLASILHAQRRIIGALPDVARVMTAVAQEAKKLTRASGAFVELAEGDVLVCSAVVGDAPFPLGSRRRMEPRLAVPPTASERFAASTLSPSDAEGRARRITVSLRARDTLLGVLSVIDDGDGFASADEHTVQILAGVAGDAISHGLEHDLRDRMASLGRIAAGMAHEINNPLAYVTSNLTFVLEELARGGDVASADELRAALEDARDGAERIAAIVAQLRVFARATPADRAPNDITKIVQGAVKMAWNEIRHRANLVEDYGTSAAVLGNRVQLGQVFLNLLVNAAQAIASTGRRGTVRVRTFEEPTGEVVVDVSDDGPGISEAHLARIFDPFFTTKPVGAGVGLGLSISYGIVNAHDGTLTVRSQLGVGTTFRVVLPKSEPIAVEEPRTSSAGRYSLRRARILVIDDEPAVCQAVRRVLAPEHDVVLCPRAREALDRIRRGESFDAILCDVMMPDLDGPELHRLVAESQPALAARFVFFTGGAFSVEAAEYVRRHGSASLGKPWKAEDLRAAVGGVLAPGT